MQRTQPIRGIAPHRSDKPRAVLAALAASIRRFLERRGEMLSLMGGIVMIVAGACAFWISQPASLFDGAVGSVSQRANTCVRVSRRDGTFKFNRGITGPDY